MRYYAPRFYAHSLWTRLFLSPKKISKITRSADFARLSNIHRSLSCLTNRGYNALSRRPRAFSPAESVPRTIKSPYKIIIIKIYCLYPCLFWDIWWKNIPAFLSTPFWIQKSRLKPREIWKMKFQFFFHRTFFHKFKLKTS